MNTTITTPHPALSQSKAIQRAMGERDRLTEVPLPNAEEAALLRKLYPGNMLHAADLTEETFDKANKGYTTTLSMHGQTVETKLAMLRLGWFGWGVHNPGSIYVHRLTYKGFLALRDHLDDLAANGDAEALTLRQKLFPTEEDRKARQDALDRHRRTEEAEYHRHQMRAQCWGDKRGQESAIYGVEGRMLEIAHILGSGANDIDDLLSELRQLKAQIETAKREIERIDADEERIIALSEDEVVAIKVKAAGGYRYQFPWSTESGGE
jgi:hypothetical protein